MNDRSISLCNTSRTEDISILIMGQGAFGTAIKHYLERQGYRPKVWKRGEPLDIIGRGNDFVIFAVPAQVFREVLLKEAPYLGDAIIVNLAKGIECGTHKRMSEIAFEIVPDARYVALSGPSHAEEIELAMPTDVAIASSDSESLLRTQNLLFSESFRVYTNDDVVGTEIGGSLKNVIAIASGICDGLCLGDNAKAALITRGLAEMKRMGEALGAKPVTFLGLSGVGDLIVTCMSMHSRNRRFGILVGQGKSKEEALREVGQVVEGVTTCESAYQLSKIHGVDMPITSLLYHFINNNIDLDKAVKMLISRGKKAE